MPQDKKVNYGAEQIQVLEGLEAVRKRPGMYIGSTSLRGLHHLVYEVVDNSIDEALAGYCTHIEVTIEADNSITVVDNGRGIPVAMHKIGKPAVEVVLTVLHAGGKFGGDGYPISGGLHGVGISVVNALSQWTKVEVKRDGYWWNISFARGLTAEPLKKIRPMERGEETGTKVSFKPDADIFPDTTYDFDTLKTRLRELAFLNKGLHITLTDKRGEGRSEVYCYEGGLTSFVEFLNENKEAVNPTVITLENTFSVNNTDLESGSMVPGVKFDGNGLPQYYYVSEMEIEWANGAKNMNGDYNQGTPITLIQGNVGTNDGLTSLSGSFTTNYIKQDGAQFGSYAGVSISEDGVVTALYDNGETRPIAILPLATFTNPNGMTALTGNAWIETDASGQALLKMANTNGAGTIESNSLEQSTVDLATEFSNMIITQRAYSAATKIITTADEMLDELTRMT